MNKYLLLASMAGLSTFAAPAFGQTSGTVGLNYSRADAGAGDTDAWGVNGGVAIPTGGSVVVLLDGSYNHNDDADLDAFTGTAHLVSRNSDSAWGGFVGFANFDAGAGDVNAWGAGGEYAKFFDTSTLALTAAYATVDDTDVDIWGLNAEYRLFANDNLRFDIGAGWANVDTGLGDGDGTQIGAGFEYRFDNSPISIGANLAHVDTDGLDVDVVGATLRFDFGNGSLKARDRNGNTFGSFGGLTNFIF